MLQSWIDIEGYSGRYSVSNTGLIRSNDRSVRAGNGYRTVGGSVIKQQIGYGGYYCVYLRKDGSKKNTSHYVHRLVAQHFIPNPLGKGFVNHIDGDKKNNSSSNLEWVTKSENAIHALELGLSIPLHKRHVAERGHKRKTSIQVVVVRDGIVVSVEESIIHAAKSYRIDSKIFSGIKCTPKQYKGLTFYGIKLHEAGITWDKMQEYIGRPESHLSEVFKWQEKEKRAMSICERR